MYRTPPRRSYDRIPVHYPVWFRRGNAPFGKLGEPGTIINLSLRGCHVRSSAQVPRGTVVSLEFQPSPQSFPITIDGAIVRSVTADGIGVRFVKLWRADERRIRRILELRAPSGQASPEYSRVEV